MDNQLRILFFGTYFRFMGKETYISDEIESVVNNYPNIKYLVYTVGPYNKSNSIIRYSKNILWVRRKELRNPKVFLRFLKEIITIFIKFKPDIVHSTYVIESIIMGFFGKLFKVPTIFHSRGMDFNFYPFIKIRSNILARIACKLNNIVITVSKVMKLDSIRLNVPQKKVISLYDGIDLLLFNPVNSNFKNNYQKLEILNVGRFVPIKCQEMIIETCKTLSEKGYNFHLTLTGYGPLENDLRNLIKRYQLENQITITGYIDHDKIPEIMKKVDIYIQPSLTEGMPISVLEAMSMKLPVVLTKVGGMPELIKNNDGGILIEINDKEQLYNAILEYYDNPKKIKTDGERNREFIIKNFNWIVHANRLNNIYLNLKKHD